MNNFEYIKNHYQTPAAFAKFLNSLLYVGCRCCAYRIKTNEGEVAFKCNRGNYNCEDGIKQWLEMEVEKNDCNIRRN